MRRLRKGPRPQVSIEDNPAASAAEDEVPQVATPLSHQEVVLQENVLVTDPPTSQVEDENHEAATTTNEANVEPSPAKASEDNEATDPATSIPESAVGPQFNYHVEHRPQVQKPIPRLPRFPGPASAPGSFNINGFRQTTRSSIAPRTPIQGKEYHLIGSGAIISEAITLAFSTTKVASSHTSALMLKL